MRAVKAIADVRWMRPYNLRHQTITELYEDPNISEGTVEAIAGHQSARMKATYSHIRIEAKREALERLSRNRLGLTGELLKPKRRAPGKQAG